MDRLHFQQAFANDPEEAVNNIRNGIAVNLAKQRALYLLMDLGEYDVKYQYNYQLEGQLPSALLPTLEGLPIASEASKMITLPELVKISNRRLKRTFPNLVELKVVLRELSPAWLTKLAKVVAAFSRQLTALQLLIFSDSLELTTLWGINNLQRLFSHLNDAHFDHLRHFTLLFEDNENKRIHPLDLKSLRLLSSETLEECYLRLPGRFIEPQLKLLGEKNQRLQRLGLIASCTIVNEGDLSFPEEESEMEMDLFGRMNKKILTSPYLAAKTVHLMFPSGYRSRKLEASFFGWQMDLNHLEKLTSLRTLRIRLYTDGAYLRKLRELGSLTHLQISMDYIPVREAAIFQPLSQLALCSPSVTYLKIEVESIADLLGYVDEGGELVEFSHETFTHRLSILRHFPNLQQLEVVFPRDYSCSLCEIYPGNDGRKCMEKAMRPFRALDQLKASFSQL